MAQEKMHPTHRRAPEKAAKPERKDIAVKKGLVLLRVGFPPGRRSGRRGAAEMDSLEPENGRICLPRVGELRPHMGKTSAPEILVCAFPQLHGGSRGFALHVVSMIGALPPVPLHLCLLHQTTHTSGGHGWTGDDYQGVSPHPHAAKLVESDLFVLHLQPPPLSIPIDIS
jgi:hypothetical protein